FVNKDNPLERLTLAELDAIVGCERRRGHAPIRTWGDLGLGGEWAGKAIHAHLYDADTRTGHFFRRTVLGGSFKMEWERVSEYRDAAPILKALRSDRYGIAVASLKYATPEVKAVALAREPGGPYVQATPEAIIERSYPLARRGYAFIDVPPGKAIDPKVR